MSGEHSIQGTRGEDAGTMIECQCGQTFTAPTLEGAQVLYQRHLFGGTLGHLFGGLSATVDLDALEANGGEGGDEPTRLYGSGLVHVAGFAVPVHVEMVAVKADEVDGIQRAEDPLFEENLDALYTIDAGDGPRRTFHHKGRDYVLMIYPFCD